MVWDGSRPKSDAMRASGLPSRWRVLQVHADLGAPTGAYRVEVDRSGGDDVGSRKRSPRDQLVLDLVDDLGVPLDAPARRVRRDPVRCAVSRFGDAARDGS